jgi:YfiH family protein
MQPETSSACGWSTPHWPAPPGVRALSTWRVGGVSRAPFASLNLADHVGDAPSAVAENRRRLRAAARLPAEPLWLRQVHGVDVADLDRPESVQGRGGEALAGQDAAFAREPGRICAILTADCLPILVAARDGSAVGAAHAGWRGLAGGVIAATLGALALPPGDLIAWLGPCIGPERYEVGAEVRAAILAVEPDGEPAFVGNDRGRFLADLRLIARMQLIRCGLTEIHASAACTHSDPARYFSHRRDASTGRQASLIWRTGPEDG